jgi:hypothetical protein
MCKLIWFAYFLYFSFSLQVISSVCLSLLVGGEFGRRIYIEQTLTYDCDCIVSSPFSYSCKKYPRDAEDQLEAALGAVSALRQPYGTSFMVRRPVSLTDHFTVLGAD